MIEIPAHSLDAYRETIQGQAWKHRHETDAHKRGNAHFDVAPRWADGTLLAQYEQPHAIGVITTVAVTRWINRQLGGRDPELWLAEADLNIYEFGDKGWDFRIMGTDLKFDVKSSGRFDKLLVKRVAWDGTVQPLTATGVVRVDWRGGPIAKIVGWCPRDLVLKLDLMPAYIGTHKNVEILRKHLFPAEHLLALIRRKALLAGGLFLFCVE